MALVREPLSKCPGCGRDKSFGRCLVARNTLIFRCASCNYSERKPLPTLKKAIIYFDQAPLSLMLKSKEHGRGEPFWAELYDRLINLSTRQITVYPTSDFHREETQLSVSLRDELTKFYQQLGGNASFKLSHHIEIMQLRQSLMNYLRKESNKKETCELWREAFKENPHEWPGYFSVHSNIPFDEEEITRKRRGKKRVARHLEPIFKEWQQNPYPFEDQVKEELKSYSRAIWDIYKEYRRGWSEMLAGIKPFDPMYYGNAREEVIVVEQLINAVIRETQEKKNAIGIVRDFLFSEECYKTPFVIIRAKFWAALAMKVYASGGARKPKQSDTYDIDIISHLAPYCNAMFIDNEFRALASENPLKLQDTYKVQLYSAKTRADFLEYLKNLDKETPPEVAEAVEMVYPGITESKRL